MDGLHHSSNLIMCDTEIQLIEYTRFLDTSVSDHLHITLRFFYMSMCHYEVDAILSAKQDVSVYLDHIIVINYIATSPHILRSLLSAWCYHVY